MRFVNVVAALAVVTSIADGGVIYMSQDLSLGGLIDAIGSGIGGLIGW